MSRVPGRRLQPLALAYHGIADVPRAQDPDGLFVGARYLARHVDRLRSWGYRFVTFGELAQRTAAGEHEGCVALTFDDGLADNLTHMAPVIAAAGVPATVFVVSGWVGGTHALAPWAPILSAEQLRELHGAGVQIGAHTVTHADLTTLEQDAARRELEDSRFQLETLLDAPVQVAAYPYGRANEHVRAACRAVGFAAACRTGGIGSWADPFDLPRQDMDNGTSTLSLRLKRSDRYERLMRRRAGRAARRAVRLAHRIAR